MKILAIETSCDDTAISIVEATGGLVNPHFKTLSQIISSQAKIHAHWGGVVPSLAKREHGRNLTPILKKILEQSFGSLKYKISTPSKDKKKPKQLSVGHIKRLKKILEREPELLKDFLALTLKIEPPAIDYIAVTKGPGLEPALWVGINFAKALALVWDKPLIGVNHMEGHLASVLLKQDKVNHKSQTPNPKLKIRFPAIALLVSGGHTELVLIKKWLDYKIVGQTRDDAAGEAFDKVARLLDLSYPGGPEISRLAKQAPVEKIFALPRPMIDSPNFDFSFSGLKTAVLCLIKDKKLSDREKSSLASEFEEAMVETLIAKTKKAAAAYEAKTVIVAGGVSANEKLRGRFETVAATAGFSLLIPPLELTTDNATMIAIAAYLQLTGKIPPLKKSPAEMTAQGNLSF